MEEKDNVLEEEIASEQPLSEYDAKVAEYECKLEEAFVNIEIKENIALANPEDEAALHEYKEAKANYEALRKEYKQFKAENKPITWWTTLPIRMKIFSFFNFVLAFPFFAWSILPFWYYPYSWLYDIFANGLNKLFDNGKETMAYIYLGLFWYFLVLVLICWFIIILVITKYKKDIHPNYKKTFIGFIIGNSVFTIGLLVYQIVLMIQMWSL